MTTRAEGQRKKPDDLFAPAIEGYCPRFYAHFRPSRLFLRFTFCVIDKSRLRIGSLSGVCLFQRATFVHCDMVGFVALDFILWIIGTRVVRVSLVIRIFCMNLDDLAADVTGLRVPGHVIANFEICSHDGISSVIAGSITRCIAKFCQPVGATVLDLTLRCVRLTFGGRVMPVSYTPLT